MKKLVSVHQMPFIVPKQYSVWTGLIGSVSCLHPSQQFSVISMWEPSFLAINQYYEASVFITITRLCTVYSHEPHFYIAKPGYVGVFLFFSFLLQSIDCGYSLEPLGKAVLTCTHNLCLEQKYEKYQNFSAENFQFLKLILVYCMGEFA